MSIDHARLASDELYGFFCQMSTLASQPEEKKEEQTSSAPLTLEQKLKVNPRIHKLVDDSTIEYGFSSQNLPQHSDETFYVSTAINYTNGFPHIGHAYEAVTSDIIARYHRMMGKDTFFQTGTDEHGQKIANTAERLGVTPLQLCDVYSEAFRALNQRLLISNNHFVRTNHAYHLKHAQDLWRLCADAGDIYLSKYEGWYNEREEAFVSNQEAEKNNFKDPVSGKDLTRTEEESYFFRMSKYQEALINHIEANPTFIQPDSIRAHILSRLQNDRLEDLSISRTSFEWGIPVPEGFDPKHVMYVWFDALSNYASGVFTLENEVGEGVSEEELSRKKYWPASLHMIGKDIAWFHTVIWPCMLMSAGVPLPEEIYSHGFVSDSMGRKMSKSLGNVVDPHEALDKFPAESLRYYLVTDAVFGGDLNFSISNFVDRHNAELHDTLGNLSHRLFSLSAKYCGATMPEPNPSLNIPTPFDVQLLRENIVANLESLSLHELVARTWDTIRGTNQWLTEQEPWKKTRTDEEKVEIVRLGLEAMYIIGHVIAPVLPLTAHKILKVHFPPNTPIRTIQELLSDSAFQWLAPGTPTTVGSVLFTKVTEAGVIASDEEEKKKEEEKERKKKLAEENRKKKKQQKQSQAKALNIWEAVELRVGVIEEIKEVEDSDKLFVEQINVGESKEEEEGKSDESTLQVLSGLRAHYSLEQMQGRLVLVLCNIRPANMAGMKSNGMVLACQSEDGSQVELLTPPEGSQPGDRLISLSTLSSQEGGSCSALPEPISANQMKKKKVWEKCMETFTIDPETGIVGAQEAGELVIASPSGEVRGPVVLSQVKVGLIR